MFDSIIGDNITLSNFIIIIVSALILGLIISYVHFKSTKSSKNYIVSLVMMPMLISTIIIVVNGSLGRAVAILGSFSLIRFRSVPASSKEIMSIFMTMVIGTVLGSGYVVLAYIFTLITSLELIVLEKTKYGESIKTKELKVLVPEDLDYTNIFNDIFDKYTDSYELIKTNTTNMGSMYELKYKINLKKEVKEKEFIDEIRVRNGNLRITLSNELLEGTL